MKLLERNLTWMYSVYEAPSGDLYIEVVAGGIGLYYVRARLDDRERELYRDDPSESETIARKLLKWRERFDGRIVSDEEWNVLMKTGDQP